MDELYEFCLRVIGPEDAADVADRARRSAGGDRVGALAEAAAISHRHPASEPQREEQREADGKKDPELSLPDAVARELRVATRELPQRQREALVLRELLGLAHEDMARVLGIEAAAVPALISRSRLGLRRKLRGGPDPTPDCAERDRSLRALARRQDGEASEDGEQDWLLDHLGSCADCTRAHAAMLEASACYRAWRAEGDSAAGGPS